MSPVTEDREDVNSHVPNDREDDIDFSFIPQADVVYVPQEDIIDIPQEDVIDNHRGSVISSYQEWVVQTLDFPEVRCLMCGDEKRSMTP